MKQDDNKNTNKPDADYKESDSQDTKETDGKNPSLGENNPDEILEKERDDSEDTRVEEPIGENLGTQGGTQDQTSGEDGTGGFSDEAYGDSSENNTA